MKKLVCSLIACLNFICLAIPVLLGNPHYITQNNSNSLIRSQHTLLHDQMIALSAEEAVPSQIFPDEPMFDCQAADDFIVPDGERWIIHEIVVPGLFSEPDVLLPIHGVLSYFNHVGAPGHPETIPFFNIDLEFNLDADGNLVLFPPPFEFHPGHYWLSVQVIMPLSKGQWKWKKQQTPTILEEYHWRNPEPWIKASLIISDLITVDHNLSFSLFGDVLHPEEAVCPIDYHVCIDTPPFPLEGATPEGGIYEGPGIHDGMFFPLETGSGAFLIVYTYSNPFGAISTCDFLIHVAPTPIAYAGSNKSIIAGEQIAMHDAFTDHSDASEWTTSGDGFFDHPFNPQSTYIPGISDITDGEVELCITAQPIPPCTTPAADCMLLVIDPGDYPVIECPPDIVTANDEGVCFASGIELDEPLVTDPFGITHLFNDAPSEYPVGNTMITWTAINIYEATNTCQQLVTVIDVETPEMEPPDDIHIGNDPGQCGATVQWEPPPVSDNCDPGSVTGSHQPGDFFPVGDTDVRYTATDMHGNTSTAGFRVTVIDMEPPETHPGHPPPEDITIPNDPGHCGGTAHWEPPGFIDNCGEITLQSNHQPGSYFPVGHYDIQYIATDSNGNSSQTGFTLEIIDETKPEIACPANIKLYISDPPEATPVELPEASPPGGQYVGTGVEGNTFYPHLAGIGTHTITYTFVNPGSGCSYNCSFEIELIVATGIKQIGNAFIIYPNPSKGIFTIEGNGEEPVGIHVIDMIGKEVMHFETMLPAQLNMVNQPKGIYFIRLQSPNAIFLEKIILQ